MRTRHPLPRIWLMTDERIPDLEGAIAGLPRGSGIVFRHYSLEAKARRSLFNRVRRLARRGKHVLVLAGTPALAKAWGADGAHNRSALVSRGLRTTAAHTAAEKRAALRVRADLLFMSPVFATRSHPGKPALKRTRLGLLAGKDRSIVIALGGLTRNRAKSLGALKLYGWAAIDAFSPP